MKTTHRLERRAGRVQASVLVFCIAFALGAVALAWWRFRPSGAVTSYLQIDFSSGSLLSDDRPPSEAYMQRLKRNHSALLRSPLVFETALQRQEIAQLDLVQGRGEHALKWLQDAVTVSFPDDSEFMEVRLGGLRESELPAGVKVLDALVKAYTDKVVYQGRLTENARRDDLKTALESLHVELKQSLGKLDTLKANSGGEPADAATIVLLEDEIHAKRDMARELQAKVFLMRVEQTMRDTRSSEGNPWEPIRVVQPALPVDG